MATPIGAPDILQFSPLLRGDRAPEREHHGSVCLLQLSAHGQDLVGLLIDLFLIRLIGVEQRLEDCLLAVKFGTQLAQFWPGLQESLFEGLYLSLIEPQVPHHL